MAPRRPTHDMGRFSLLHQRICDSLYDHHKQQNGPISGRTRCRQISHHTSTTPSLTRTARPQNPETQFLPTHLRPSTGIFTRPARHLTKRSLTRATRTLRRTRLRLIQHLNTSPGLRDRDGELLDSTYFKIEQLPITQTGAMQDEIPEPERARWDSENEMRRKRLRKRRRDMPRLSIVSRIWSDEEIDGEFGVLPGEDWDEDGMREVDLQMEMEVDERLVLEGRVLEELCDGERAEGVWRALVGSGGADGSEEGALVLNWAFQEDRERKGVVMDGRCVGIVRGVRLSYIDEQEGAR